MKGYMFAVLAAICFSAVGVLIKIIGTSIPIMSLSFLRVFLAFIFLAVAVPLLDKNFLKQSKRDILAFAVIGFLMALNQTIFNSALLLAPVSNIVLISSLWIVFAAFFAFVVLKEKLTRFESIAFVLSLTGLAIINPLEPTYLLGNSLAIINSITWALLVVLMRFEDKGHTVSTIFWIFLFATLFLSPFPLIYGVGDIASNIPWLLGLGIVSTGLAYLLVTFALERIDTDHYAIISLVVCSVFAIALAVIILSEALTIQVLAGGSLLILAGIVLQLKEKMP